MIKSITVFFGLFIFVLALSPAAYAINQVGSFSELGMYRDVWQQGSYAYMASGWADLRTVDVSDYSNMRMTDWWLDRSASGDESYSIFANDDYLFLAERTNGVRIFSLADKAKPALLSTFNPYAGDPYYRASSVSVSGSTLYVGDFMGGFVSVDIKDPSKPVELDRITFKKETGRSIEAQGFAVKGNYAYVANPPGGFSVVDVSNPANLVTKTYVTENEKSPLGVWDIGVKGDYAYVLVQGVGVEVYNVETPDQPTLVATVELPNGKFLNGVSTGNDMPPLDIEFYGNVAFVSNGIDGVYVLDISDPEAMTQDSILETFDPELIIEEQLPRPYSYSWGMSLDFESSILLVADGHNGIAAFDISEYGMVATPLPPSFLMLISGLVPFLYARIRRTA
ncbi:LVIVD repeat-containing protein [Pseudodesulfovibrio portus]|uniref:LVIVD repeat protein n=1 Tax=Pseudodesulfovibrio portus TaxID=231439 RepID=A0ABM8AVA8_9BACT|nr:hypothetical protein [Pseudodesulfovibrio portus]BDQ35469.1 hypothetical protein JCM14722_30110 [Pseudodesulfovibrio portus]